MTTVPHSLKGLESSSLFIATHIKSLLAGSFPTISPKSLSSPLLFIFGAPLLIVFNISTWDASEFKSLLSNIVFVGIESAGISITELLLILNPVIPEAVFIPVLLAYTGNFNQTVSKSQNTSNGSPANNV